MMISTKGRYALRMLVDMAEHERGGGYVPLKEIAARQEISEKYLESIVKLLVQNNVLIGVRGKGGGYRLNGTPDQFTVRRILEITEGSLAPVACLCEPHDEAIQCRRARSLHAKADHIAIPKVKGLRLLRRHMQVACRHDDAA